MTRKDSEHQKKSMSKLFRGKAIFKPLNTGRIAEAAQKRYQGECIEPDKDDRTG